MANYYKVSFTLGDAYALPRADFFWAFSPLVERSGT